EAASGGDTNGPSVLTEALIGGAGALVILLFVFGTLPAVAMPIAVAIASILNTFTLIYVLTYITSVSLIVQFLVALVGPGLAIVGVLLVAGLQIKPAEAQLKDYPGKGDAINGRQALAKADISPGVMKPYIILVENAGAGGTREVVGALEQTPGIAAAVAPPQWRQGGDALVEAFPTSDSAASSSSRTISRIQHDVLPSLSASATLGGISPEDRDFVHAVYGKFPYALAFVILLTFVLLMRAFRSIVLPLKAVILNLISLGAAYGIIVFIFQWGHGSDAIWGV